nr:hypothetical protein [Bradyrhizobium sp.]
MKLASLISDMTQCNIGQSNVPPVTAADLADGSVYPFVDYSPEPDPRIVAEQPKFGVSGPANARKKTDAPGNLAFILEREAKAFGIGKLEALIGVDIQDPVSAGLPDCKITCRGKIIAPRKRMNRDRIAASFVDRIVARPGIDNDNLVDDAT